MPRVGEKNLRSAYVSWLSWVFVVLPRAFSLCHKATLRIRSSITESVFKGSLPVALSSIPNNTLPLIILFSVQDATPVFGSDDTSRQTPCREFRWLPYDSSIFSRLQEATQRQPERIHAQSQTARSYAFGKIRSWTRNGIATLLGSKLMLMRSMNGRSPNTSGSTSYGILRMTRVGTSLMRMLWTGQRTPSLIRQFSKRKLRTQRCKNSGVMQYHFSTKRCRSSTI